MAGATNQHVIGELRRLKSDLAQRYGVERFILFGSRARNEELLTSDVDLIVVSDSFRGTKFRHRPERVLELWSDVVDLQVLCYTPEEYAAMTKRIGVVQRAAAEGVEL